MLDQGRALKESLIKGTVDGYKDFYRAVLRAGEWADRNKMPCETGNLFGQDHGNRIKSLCLRGLDRLLQDNLSSFQSY